MKKTQKTIYIFSFIIPFLLFIIFAAILKLYPFGDGTVLYSDNRNQFVSFYTYFKNNLLTHGNYFYTFSKNLGGDMTGFFAYYLHNPFLFLLLFVKNENIPALLYYIEALQLSLAGLTFQILISHVRLSSVTDNNSKCYASLIFSTAYSLTGYVVGYFTLQIYFCNIIMLPLVILGLHLLFEKKYRTGSLVYITSLALSIIFNYYIGYMICIFSLLYALYLIFVDVLSKTCNVKDLIPTIKIFVLSSLSAGFLSFFTLLPTIFSLRGAKEAPNAQALKFFRTYRIFDSFTDFFTGSYDGNVSNVGFPKIYIGIIPAFLVLCFLLNKKVKLKERLCTLIFITIMILSLNIHTFNVIWHGFNEPVGFGYRFAFLLSFLLLLIAYKGFFSSPDKVVYIISLGITLIFALYAIILNKFTQSALFIVFDIIVIALFILLCFTANKYGKDYAWYAIIFICIFEIALNGFYSLKINLSSADSLSEYQSQYDRIYNLIEEIKQSDEGLYRIEKDFMYNMQDAMTFSYNGLSHNSSCETDNVKRFMGNMGFRNQGIWAFYNQGSTAFADSFLGVKYFVSRFDSTNKPYDTSFNIDSDYVFKNTYALPLAFLADKEAINNVNLDTKNLFEVQNEIARCFYFDEDIYEASQLERVEYINLKLKDSSVNEYEKINNDIPAYIEFTAKINNDKSNLYFLFDAPKKQGGIRVYVNDFDFDDYFTDWRFNIECAGKFKEGETVNIKLKLDGTDCLILDNYYLYEEKLDALAKWSENADALGLKNVVISKYSSSHLTGEINLPLKNVMNNDIVFSIPYDDSWHVTINGHPADTYKTLDALLAIDLSPFYNSSDFRCGKINMYFIPKGLIIGSAISIITLIVLIVIYTNKRQ